MFRFASDLSAALDDLQAHVTIALQTDPSPAIVNASGDILRRMQHAQSLCRDMCDATLKQSPLAALAHEKLGSPKKGRGIHEYVKAAYSPPPPRVEDEQRRAVAAAKFTQQLQIRWGGEGAAVGGALNAA